MNYREQRQLYDLITSSVEGIITPEQFSTLKEMLRSHPDAVKYYVDYMSILSDIRSSNSLLDKDAAALSELNDSACDLHFWQALAEEEKTAPEVEIQKEQPQRELIQKVVYPPREKRTVSKFSIFFLVMNAAAILFFILFIKFAPSRIGIEVATLADSVNAKWTKNTGPMETGKRLTTRSDDLILQDGLAELLFDNNTKVVVEGPAELELLAADQINLRYGRIYATVPPEAIGFTVNTPTTRIIDLGTEFGVQADSSGDVHLHVIKGETTLITGDNSNRVKLEVSEGQAKKVTAATLAVSDIPCETELFVRDIRYLWRRQLDVNLANMIGRDITIGDDSLICKQGSISQKLWTYFRPEDSPVSLDVGEQLIATIEFTPRGHLYDNSFRGFRFGLFNDPTDHQVLIDTNTDSGGDDDPWMDARGYGVEIALSKGPAKSAKPYVGKRTDLTDPSLMGSFDAWIFSSGGDPVFNRIDTRYTLTLELDRIAENQMQVTFTIADADGVISEHTILDDPPGTGEFGTDPIATDFDQFFLRFSTAETTADTLEFHRFKLEYISNSAPDGRGMDSRRK